MLQVERQALAQALRSGERVASSSSSGGLCTLRLDNTNERDSQDDLHPSSSGFDLCGSSCLDNNDTRLVENINHEGPSASPTQPGG